MTLAPGYCYTSDMLYAGGSAWINRCTIDVIDIIDTNYVKVKVYPLHEGAISLTMKQDQPYDFIDFQAPFRITPTSIFYTDLHKAARFKLCDLVEPPKPTLYVNYIMVGLDPGEDVPQYDRFGVKAQIAIKGTGVGNLKIDWGNDHSETVRGVRESNTTYKYNLPPGVHNVCANLFSIEL